MHNVITDNCKKIRREYQPTTVRLSELKAVLEVTTTHLHTSWKITACGTSCKRRCIKHASLISTTSNITLELWVNQAGSRRHCYSSASVASTSFSLCEGGWCLVLHYLNDIPCKNCNYTFVFAKVIPKTLRTRCRTELYSTQLICRHVIKIEICDWSACLLSVDDLLFCCLRCMPLLFMICKFLVQYSWLCVTSISSEAIVLALMHTRTHTIALSGLLKWSVTK